MLERRRQDFGDDFADVPFTLLLRTEDSPDGLELIDPPAYEPMIRFLSQPRLLFTIARYIGEMPVIGNISICYTPINNEQIGSQNFHRDTNGARQVHVLVCLDDVDMESGPFTMFPKKQSDEAARRLGYHAGRIKDEDLFSVVDEKELVYATGKAGDTFLVNANDCIHYGARARGKPRLVMIANMTSAFEWAEGTEAIYRARNRDALDDGTAVRRMLLRL